MRLNVAVFAIISMAIVVGAMPLTWQDEGDVRGAFLTSRPKEKTSSSNSGARAPSRRRPKTVKSTGPTKSSVTPNPNDGVSTTASTDKARTKVNAPRIGLGLTLFIRDSNGLAVRTDPTHVFQKGDRVRVLLETNADGYMYIFNTTNDGPPVMVYPDAELDEAGNYLQAHVPFEIPSSMAPEERLRWLVFDENAGDEHLFFVFTKEPLADVPIEDALINYCRDKKSACPFRPDNEMWAGVMKQLNEPLQTDRSAHFGGAQTAAEQQATTRGIGLAKDDPEPSLIMMASSTSSTLVTSLDLTHK
jgi:Domain of unknown function (DUF4384)